MRSSCAVAPSGADLVNELLESDDGMEGGDECAECSSDEVLADTPVGLVGRGGGAGRKPAVVPEAERAGGRVCASVVDISELERNRMPSAALCSCVCVRVRECESEYRLPRTVTERDTSVRVYESVSRTTNDIMKNALCAAKHEPVSLQVAEREVGWGSEAVA